MATETSQLTSSPSIDETKKDCEDKIIGIDVVSIKKPTGSAGFAPIKAEFILHNYKPKLQTEYLSAETKEKLGSQSGEANNGVLNDKPQDSTGKRLVDDSETANIQQDEPPNKKQKIKGRNKQRPKFERIVQKDRLCPSIKQEKVCNYGDNCRFNHDIKDFLENKLPDLPGPCYVFDTFGFCRFGLSCRLAKNHMSDDMKNMTNNELFEKKKHIQEINIMNKDVRQQLWKKKYNFKKADKMVKAVQNMNSKEWENIKQPQINPHNVENVSNNNESLSGVESSPTKDIKVESSPSKEIKPPCCDIKENIDSKKLDGPLKMGSDDNTCLITASDPIQRTMGQITDEELFPLRGSEKVKIDFRNKTYLAPLTTVGNLPFRRVCKDLGVDITCGEMALATQILQAKQSEWSLLKRHPSEDLFGVQICGGWPDTMSRCAQLITETCDVDFIDINCGCPIDLIYNKGCGSALMGKSIKLTQICASMIGVMGSTPLTVKLRKGVHDKNNSAHLIIPKLRDIGVSLVTVHGRSREQRYTRGADWGYISQCVEAGGHMPVFGNGDVLSYEDANLHMETHNVSGCMVARGALIKPWIFTEIKEQRHWDISANERLDLLRSFTNYGLEHWGSDTQGVETTRRFMLEWLSFLHRYIPCGLLETLPQRIHERPPYYVGRSDLETLMASANCADWVKITEMLLGPVPSSFKFLPKHKANAYQ